MLKFEQVFQNWYIDVHKYGIPITPIQLANLLKLRENKDISNATAKDLFHRLWEYGRQLMSDDQKALSNDVAELYWALLREGKTE